MSDLRWRALFSSAALIVALLALPGLLGCGNSSDGGAPTPPPTPVGEPPPGSPEPAACTSAEGSCLQCPQGFYCCTLNGACWNPETEPDNCKFTTCFTNDQCNLADVCQVSAAPPPGGEHKITFVNRSGQTVWVAGINGNGVPNPMDVGGWDWELPDGASKTITVPYGWDSGRFWPRTGCTATGDNGLKCQTGDCNGLRNCVASGNPPASLAEFTLDGGAANPGGNDNYNASFVDGWNLLLTIEPDQPQGSGDPPFCGVAGCATTPKCPDWGKTTGGCLSPCQVGHDTRYCCTCSLTTDCTCGQPCCDGQYGCSPYSNPPSPHDQICDPFGEQRPDAAWEPTYQDYVTEIHAVCPTIYAWQYDDTNGLFSCRGNGTLVNYTITFLNPMNHDASQ